jgi:hypothetical protein
MPKFSKILNNFLGGEISPFRLGRSDVDGLFTNGCLKMENCIPQIGGGFSRRAGTEFIKDVTSAFSTYDDVKIIPFVFSKEESYAIVIGALNARSSSLLPSITYSLLDQSATIINASDTAATVSVRAPTYRGGDGTNLTGTYSRTGTTVTVTITGHGLVTGNTMYFNATSGSATDGFFTLTGDTANTFTFTHGTSGATSGNVTIYKGVVGSYVTYRNGVTLQSTYNNELGHAEEYEVADLDELQWQQINDVLVIVHKNHPPIYLVREAENSFVEYSFRDFCRIPNVASFTTPATWQSQWMLGIPYRDIVIDPSQQPVFTVSATTLDASCTVTITNPNAWGGFVAGHVGTLFRATESTTTGVVVITAVTSSTVATGRVIKAFLTTGAQDEWQEAAWSDAREWPRSVCYFKNRIIMGGNNNTVWASQLGDIAQFTAGSDFAGSTITATSDEPFTSSIAANESSFIQWMDAGTSLIVGSLSREYIADIEASQSVSSLSVTPQTEFGSAYLQAIHLGNSTMFVDRSRRIVREFTFNFNDDNYRSEYLSNYAHHIIERHGWVGGQEYNYPKIKEITLQKTPQTTAWFLNNNGGVFAVTRDKSDNVNAWHKHVFSGTDVVPKSIAVLPNPNEGASDDLWLVIERTIDGDTVQYVEKIGREFLTPFPNENTDMVFLDSSKDFFHASVPFTALTGLDHLEGETVRVVGDGADMGDYVVSGGNITLASSVYDCVVGYPFYSTVIPLPLEAGSALGNAQGKFKAIQEIIIRFYDSIAVTLGRVKWVRNTYTGSNLDYSIYDLEILDDEVVLNFLPGDLPLNQPIPLFTGMMAKTMPNSWGRDTLFSLRTNSPFPLNIACVIVEGVTND